MEQFIKVFSAFFIMLLACVGVAFLLVWPLVWMWNYVMPDIFGLPEITFWQMFWLYVLIQCLLKLNVTVNNKR